MCESNTSWYCVSNFIFMFPISARVLYRFPWSHRKWGGKLDSLSMFVCVCHWLFVSLWRRLAFNSSRVSPCDSCERLWSTPCGLELSHIEVLEMEGWILFPCCRLVCGTLPGAHVGGRLRRVRPAVVLPPSLRGVPAICVRRLRRQRQPLPVQARVSKSVRRHREEPRGGAATPLMTLFFFRSLTSLIFWYTFIFGLHIMNVMKVFDRKQNVCK